jgi:phytoene synthase
MTDYLSINNRPNPLISNFNECRLYTRHYAKSFYFSSYLLPKEKRYAAYAIYLFCRYADNIVDMACNHTHEEVETKINSLLENLDDIYSGIDSLNKHSFNGSFSAFADTVKKYEIPKFYFTQLIEGVSMDINTKRYDTFAGLERYCYKVASVVGLIMSEIFGYKNNSALTYAIDLGKAMQLTNILRDINDDYKMGRVYIPKDELDKFGYTEDDIKNKTVNQNFTSLMKYQIARAREYYSLAERGFPYLSDDGSRTTVVLMQKIYSGILNKIEENNYDIFSRRLFVSKAEKFVITGKYLFNFAEKKRFSAINKDHHISPSPNPIKTTVG